MNLAVRCRAVITEQPASLPDWHSDWEAEFINSRLALNEGAIIRVAGDSINGLEWFVQDVNGIEQSITACTLILERPRVRTFSFNEVHIVQVVGDPQHLHEAAATYARIKSRLARARPAA